ncbi:hypothetical protein [uncultured Photobacterium sp.]|uniref:hypothetical protein n=1 Tax=uncultured Photobacterium sp. TaxID=173973 RepID=UPI0026162BD3|nr:hypothetical protein [uncultured Photobacterium sp.]
METGVDKIIEKDVIFDYTAFLSKSCQQRLSFMDALTYLIPLFEATVKTIGKNNLSSAEQLEKKALKILSSHTSDINNLIRLSSLAKQEGIMRLVVYLPYSLEERQLIELKSRIKGTVDFVRGNSEQLLFTLD